MDNDTKIKDCIEKIMIINDGKKFQYKALHEKLNNQRETLKLYISQSEALAEGLKMLDTQLWRLLSDIEELNRPSEYIMDFIKEVEKEKKEKESER